jgi:serine/threonine-protein kinase
MGEVYRARDTKLNRDVALKVLPAEFVLDPERLARFRREAQVLASLNHPNIAAIYGFEDSGSTHALVLELVEGPTLADRIAKGPLPLDEALPIARQIAEALEAAHEQGIVHRDLKPANIKVRDDGTVKVLDFGLAKLAEPAAPAGSSANVTSPTITTPAVMTGVGMLLGTAAYMAPEQAKGRPADKRSDVWAFGCVLYEMLAGKRAFEGEDVSDTLAAVLRAEPDWARIPGTVPPVLRTMLQRCLTKDRSQRLADTAVATFLLNEAVTEASSGSAPLASTARRGVWLIASSALLVGTALAAAVGWTMRPTSRPVPVARFSIALPDEQLFTGLTRQVIALSPDGTKFVYVASNRLNLRTLETLEPRVIPGTENKEGPLNPIFSPDSSAIVYASSADQTLKRIPVNGGTPVTLCSLPQTPFGLAWSGHEILIGGGSRGILRITDQGGTPESIVSVKPGEWAAHPQILPGGDGVLFTLLADADNLRIPQRWNRAHIVVQSLKTGQRTTMLDGGSDARYLPTGHLVYALGGTVFAVPFDVQHLKVTGVPVSVLEGVRRDTTAATGIAQWSVSDTGSLVFVPGPSSLASDDRVLILAGHDASTPLAVPPAAYSHPRASRDGRLVAVQKDERDEANVWIWGIAGTSAMRRLTFGGHNRFPVWSGDGQRIAFQSDRDGTHGIFVQRADGSGAVERLTTAGAGEDHVPESWSPDGETLLFSVAKGGTFTSWVLSLEDKSSRPFNGVHSAEPIGATFSPDGRWVAYSSNDTPGGTPSPNRGVFVQPFPPTGEVYQLPKDSRDFHPAWGTKELQLYYAPTSPRLAMVKIGTSPALTFGGVVPLAVGTMEPSLSSNLRDYDVMPDGRVLTIARAGDPGPGRNAVRVQFVFNWFEELKQRVPVNRQ